MNTIRLHLERLRRHYEVAVKTYDHVALLDLSHALRVWAELKSVLPDVAPKFEKTIAFRTAIPAKKGMRAGRGKRYVFAYMPGGVVTFAAKGQIAAGPDLDGPDSSFTLGAAVKLNADGSMTLKNYSMVSAALEDSDREALRIEDQKRCNYLQWMGAEAVRLSYPSASGELKALTISREMIIKRVANTMDGSHPSAAGSVNDGENSFDEAVHHLLQYQMGGLPLPYFILLKIAQDILDIAPRLLSEDAAEGAS